MKLHIAINLTRAAAFILHIFKLRIKRNQLQNEEPNGKLELLLQR